MERRKTRLGSNKSAFRTLHRGDFWPWDRSSGRWRSTCRHRRFPAASPVPVQPAQGRPLMGRTATPGPPESVLARHSRGRRIRPFGLPPPAKLSLCPTSVTPLEAPLIGQDASRIRQVLGTGIRNAQKFFRQRLQHRRVGKGALAPCPAVPQATGSKKMVGTLRFAHPTACACGRRLKLFRTGIDDLPQILAVLDLLHGRWSGRRCA